jgi:hypothetical protein
MVAALGIIGIVAGQLINAHREDKRWRREQAREDLRWKRESDRRTEDRAHDTARYWRDERVRVFSAFLAAISNVRIELRYASDWIRDHGDLPEDRRKRLVELDAMSRDLYAPLGIIGPSPVRDEGTLLIRASARQLAMVLDGHPVDTTPLLGQVRGFAETARLVLGVPGDTLTADD